MALRISRYVSVDIVVLTMLAGAVTVTAFMVGGYIRARELQPYISGASDELAALEQKFGPARNSEHAEEWIVRDFFQDRRDGIFVDVGANDYKHFSNTYYLESQRGWSGVAIEPQTKFAAAYAQHRPRTRFVPLFVSDVSNREAVLYVPANDLVASQSRDFAEEGGGDVKEVRARTSTLDDVLDRSGIRRVDFITMDIELAEPEALAGFSIGRFRPALVCVEGHLPVRQSVLDYFARHGYTVLGKYLRADSHNIWFAPLGE